MSTYPVTEVGAKVQESESKDIDGELPPFQLSPSDINGDKGYYGVRVVNGKMREAGTTNYSVYVTLIGSKASTGKVSLLTFFQYLAGGIGANTHMDLVIETEQSLGDVQVVILGIDGKLALDNTWFVNYTKVYDMLKEKQEIEFPCYHWIEGNESVSTTSATTTLKDVAGSASLLQQRTEQLAKKKLQYQWQFFPDWGLPSAIEDSALKLPADEEFSKVKTMNFTADALKGAVATALAGVKVTVDSLHDYVELAEHLEEQELKVHHAGRWTSDVEFGRQMLNGVNPVIITKCTALPGNFPVTNDMVQSLLTRGMTLEQEMEAGHVYICDMKIMDGLTPRDGQFATAPICLLYVNSSKQLVPIAIQLRQGLREEDKKDPNPIFFPTDGWIDWQLAKAYYRTAHGQLHELSTHYLSCHAAMEAYAMATKRCLPDAHPISKILLPHLRYTMAINSIARLTLINNGGIIDQIFAIGGAGKEELFRKASPEYSVDWTNIKRSVAERGVDNPDQLPGYYYRDDGLKIFTAFEEYVRDVVDLFYSSDEDVKSDTELQAWAEDVHTNAFPGYYGASAGHGFPKEIVSKDVLVERCTVIIFTGSVQHASINFGQYSIYGYIPNAPFSARKPPPTKKGADYQQLLDTLPDENTAKLSMNITYTLSQYSSDEIYLGDFPYKRFTETNVQRYIERLQKKLEGISGEIKVRNEGLDVPYTFMLPKSVPNSITI